MLERNIALDETPSIFGIRECSDSNEIYFIKSEVLLQ